MAVVNRIIRTSYGRTCFKGEIVLAKKGTGLIGLDVTFWSTSNLIDTCVASEDVTFFDE